MSNEGGNREEQYRKDFRAIYAETGGRTLNALLLVSGGAAIAFLTFLGNAAKEPSIAVRIGPAATHGFILAMQAFVASVACCIVAHGTTYFSHGAYHFGHDKTGMVFGGITIILGLSCVALFVYGSYAAIEAFSRAAEILTRPGHK